jgi:sec-independent protein translocase protein TatB
MFDFDLGKLLLIGVVALIFIPPKDLPDALRTLGRLIAQARRMASDFQGQFNEALREAELSQLQDDLHDLKRKASVEGTLTRVADMLETPAAKTAQTTAAVAEAPPPSGLIIVEDQPLAAPPPEAAPSPPASAETAAPGAGKSS